MEFIALKTSSIDSIFIIKCVGSLSVHHTAFPITIVMIGIVPYLVSLSFLFVILPMSFIYLAILD